MVQLNSRVGGDAITRGGVERMRCRARASNDTTGADISRGEVNECQGWNDLTNLLT